MNTLATALFDEISKSHALTPIHIYYTWPETALLAKCEDRACQGAVAEKKHNFN